MDGMPPLVDPEDSWQFIPRPDGAPGPWPAVPPTPAWGGVAPPALGYEPPPPWATAGYTPWVAPAATPVMAAHPIPMVPAVHQPMPPLHYPTPTTNDDWVHQMPRPATPARAHSVRSRTPFDSPRLDTSHISRSRSFHGSVQENVKRPPREWRPNFSMVKPGVVEAALGTIFRSRSLSRPASTNIPRVVLHPWIHYASSYPPMAYDVRENPEGDIRFAELNRPPNEWDFLRYACEQPLDVMTLVSPHFPWFVEVKSSNPVGVSLRDLFWAIYSCMSRPITHEDYHNHEMNEIVREKIALAWSIRCGQDMENRSAGVRRVDYLMGRVILRGLVRLKDGTFEMKFKHPQL